MTASQPRTGIFPWLPAAALDQDRLAPSLLERVAEWREHWMTAGDPQISPVYQDNCPLLASSMQWRSCHVAALAWREGAEWLIASDMLGHKVVAASLRPTDRRLLEGMVDAAIDDLLERIVRRFGETGQIHRPEAISVDPADFVWWDVAIAPGRPLLKLAVRRDCIARAVLSAMPAATSFALSPVRLGIAAQSVTVAAELGQCRLTLADLRGLGIGDVLVLGAGANDPITLSVNGRAAPIRASLAAGDDGATLTIIAKEQVHA